MSEPIARRVRRPKDKAELLDRLTQQDSPFDTYRDVMLFAAALGWWRERRLPFDGSDEPIRWDTMIARNGAETLVNLLSLGDTDDLTVLSDQRFAERVVVFEEYANGGLEILGSLVSSSTKNITDIARELVMRASNPEGGQEKQPIDLAGIDLGFRAD